MLQTNYPHDVRLLLQEVALNINFVAKHYSDEYEHTKEIEAMAARYFLPQPYPNVSQTYCFTWHYPISYRIYLPHVFFTIYTFHTTNRASFIPYIANHTEALLCMFKRNTPASLIERVGCGDPTPAPTFTWIIPVNHPPHLLHLHCSPFRWICPLVAALALALVLTRKSKK